MDDRASILVVDDQEVNRDLLQRRLERKGYHVWVAAGGRQALELIGAGQFELVLLDIMMPEIDGFEVLKLVRRDHSPSKLPIIMVTAKDESSDIVESLSLGANDYVTKPIDFQVLYARLGTQLALKRAEDDLRDLNQNLEQRVKERTADVIRSNKALRASEHRYQALYDENPAMFFTLGVDGTIQSLNYYGANQLGYEVEELLGQSASMLYPETEVDTFYSRLSTCLRQPGEVHQWELHKIRKGGGLIRVREVVRIVMGPEETVQLLMVCEDITDVYQLSEQISYKERHDELTGLISRQEFERRLEQALRTACEKKKQSTFCYLDLDQFKVINDTCGHDVGDELLRRLAGVMSKYVRREDALARMGGDEFGLLIDDCPLDRGNQIANELRKRIEEHQYYVGDKLFRTGVSIGLVNIDGSIKTVSEILSAADTACYTAKEEGRNRTHIYRENDREMQQIYGEMRWVARIHEALEKDLFQLYFQPIVSVRPDRGEGAHYEVLLRMRETDGNIIQPGAFLPAAERYFLSPKVDRWVVANVFRWLRNNPSHLQQLGLCSINLSGHSLADEEFAGFLLKQFSATAIPPEKICFEVTETAAIANIGAATRLMEEMRSLGCRFSLDDFGSGLSSFAYLKRLPVDFLKIDGQFVKEMVNDSVDRAMVKSIHDVAQVMGKRTIAEFVEDDAILNALLEIGVDYAQGYGISRPRPMEEMTFSAATGWQDLCKSEVKNV